MSFMSWNLRGVLTFCVSLSSTDSQLKLWNVGKPYCLRSFKGHINEKNFVGLASNGDYIACGKWNYFLLELLSRYLSPKLHSVEWTTYQFRKWSVYSEGSMLNFLWIRKSISPLLYWAQAPTMWNSIKLLTVLWEDISADILILETAGS